MPLAPDEIIPPRSRLSDAALDHLARLLDDAIPIPFTGFRIGWDAIVGLLPGIGDVATSILSLVFVFAALQRRLPKIAVTRMLLNIGIDTLLGVLPFAGDFFDALWKSNRMNYNLLVRHTAAQQAAATTGRTLATGRSPVLRESAKDWLFLFAVGFAVLFILFAPLIALWALLHYLIH